MAHTRFGLTVDGLATEYLAHAESLLAIGNGFLGMRGHPVSRIPSYQPAVFINGYYETHPIPYGEDAYGYAREAQTMLNLPDCRYLHLAFDGKVVDLNGDQVSEHQRSLDFSNGVLRESFVYTSEAKQTFTVTFETALSQHENHLGMVRLEVVGDTEAEITITSAIALPEHQKQEGLDPRVGSLDSRASLNVETVDLDEEAFSAAFITKRSGFALFCAAVHRMEGEYTATTTIDRDRMPTISFTTIASSCVLEKTFSYRRDKEAPLSALVWKEFIAEQEEHYRAFWDASDVVIDGDAELQQAIRFNLFQLHQSAGRDGRTSLAAKGLTGLGYEGQYFWDTEIYAMPLFSHTDPAIARSLIEYRISVLGAARQRAKELHQRGALFAWRTIGGAEVSAYYPASTAQYHINADIADAIFQYLELSGDTTILAEGAFDLLIETARLWVDLGFFDPRTDNAFVIHEVTGPDEYSALVDNNYYTNLMASYHLKQTAAIATWMAEYMSDAYQAAAERLGLKEGEQVHFLAAAERIYLPTDEHYQIDNQDEHFSRRKEWNSEKQGDIKHPMLLHYHPLVIYRHRLIKQADTILAQVLQPQHFRWHRRWRNFRFYERYTTGDSSLSAAIQAIVAFDIYDRELGMHYLRETALMDIADLHKNTKDGLHTAAMAGSWMTIVYGLGGYRLIDGMPTFRPYLPEGWKKLAFSLRFGETTLQVTIGAEETHYRSEGGPIILKHRSTKVRVTDRGVSLDTVAKPSAIVFDLDGVICATDALHHRAWAALAEQEGWEFDAEVGQQLRGVSRLDSLKIILEHNNLVLEEAEMHRLADIKNEAYRASLVAINERDLLPGIKELLAELNRRDIPLALASASQSAPLIVEKLGIADLFQVIVPASELEVGKPDPEIFSRAAEALGLTGEECVGVEDAQAGVEAVRAAGMRTIGVGEAVDAKTCDVHVADTSALSVELLLGYT